MAAIVGLLALLEPAFPSGSNLIGILGSSSLIGTIALGMTFVIMTRGIDLSVGPVSTIAGLVAYFTRLTGHGLVVAVIAGAGLGLMIGIANGLLVPSLGLPAIIVTLGTLPFGWRTALLLVGTELHTLQDRAAYSFVGAGSLAGLTVSRS